MKHSIWPVRCGSLAALLLVLILNVCCMRQVFGGEKKQVRVLTGHVLDTQGNPIEGATVEWGYFTAPQANRESVKTNADGSYRLKTRKYDKDYRLGVWATGWGPSWENRVIPGTTDQPKTVNFTLRKPVSVSAQLKDPVSKAPVAGVRVYLWSKKKYAVDPTGWRTGELLPGPARETHTDADGWFHFKDLPSSHTDSDFLKHRPWNPASTYHYEFGLLAEMPDSSNNRAAVRPNDPNVYTEALNSNTVKFSGRVLDQNGDPIECFYVSGGRFAKKCSSVSGRFNTLLNYAVALRVYADGYEPWEMPVPTNKEQSLGVECRMTPVAAEKSQSAVLVDGAGSPIAAAQVSHVFSGRPANEFCTDWDRLDGTYCAWFTTSRTSTTETGEFTYPSGCGLAIVADGFARRYIPASVVPSAKGSDVPKIELEPECRLHGIVTHRGQPCPNRKLELTPVDQEITGPGVFYSDEHGHFEVTSLQPGRYRLCSRIVGGELLESNHGVVLEAGETKQINFCGFGGSLELKGTAPPFGLVIATLKSRKGSAAAKADVDGNYCFEGLPAGIYDLRLWTPPSSMFVIFSNSPVKIDLKQDTVRNFKESELDR